MGKMRSPATDGRTFRTNSIRREYVRQLKDSGKKYAEIASIMGISRQRVQQLVAPLPRIAAEVIAKAGNRCEKCHKSGKRLDIHHLNYATNEVQVLCVECHKLLHPSGRPKKELVNMRIKKMVALDEETHSELVRIARENDRTLGGQVAWMVRNIEKFQVVSISNLPHPPDAEPVPLVMVAPLEK